MDGTNLIEVNFDATDIRGTDGDHAKESVPPASKKGDTLIQDK
jgi:hypothetical protein